MQMLFCPNCQKRTGFRRALGFGTFFMVLITFGLWLLIIPLYPARCMTCGLQRQEAIWTNLRGWWQLRTGGQKIVAGLLLTILIVAVLISISIQNQQPAPIVQGPDYNKPANQVSTNVLATDSVAVEDSSPNHRLKVDALSSDNEPQSVRSINGTWSKPTLIYSDDNVKVYMPFDDQLALGASFPERTWSNSSFEVLLFSAKGRMPSAKWAAEWAANRSSYIEERVSIDTSKLQFTIDGRQLIDSSGNAFATTPDAWRETRDLADPQYTVTRFITTEIIWRLTEPQLVALNALGVSSLDRQSWEHAWADKLARHYAAFVKDRENSPSASTVAASSPEIKTDALTGVYSGKVHNTSAGLWAAFGTTMQAQQGNALSGCMFVHRPMYGSGKLSGESRPSQVTFSVPSSIGVIRFTGTRAGNSITGTYVVQQSGRAEYGEFELYRQGGLPTDFDPRNCPDDSVVQ